MRFNNEYHFNNYAETRLPKNEQQAIEKFHKYQSQDPFPSIPPALLNSADIFRYVATTGMIYPFNHKKLKGASYSVRLLGECIYWDEFGKQHITDLKEGGKFVLRPNSIAFVTLEPQFRLPDYIAIRFNLKISHVYKGLLLGTGPLVDPGFEGRLSIPLHNFTINEYKLYGGQDLIWIEFTKLSPNVIWDCSDGKDFENTQGYYIKFPENKKNQKVQDYINRALFDVESINGPKKIDFCVRSSTPEELKKVNQQASKAVQNSEEAKKVSNNFKKYGVFAAITLGIALMALFYQVYSVVNDSVTYVVGAKKELDKIEEYKKNSDAQNQKIEEYSKLINNLKKELEELKKNLEKEK